MQLWEFFRHQFPVLIMELVSFRGIHSDPPGAFGLGRNDLHEQAARRTQSVRARLNQLSRSPEFSADPQLQRHLEYAGSLLKEAESHIKRLVKLDETREVLARRVGRALARLQLEIQGNLPALMGLVSMRERVFRAVYTVAFDLVGYSAIARDPGFEGSPHVIFTLNRTIETAVAESIQAALGEDADKFAQCLIYELQGDGGLIFFNRSEHTVAFAQKLNQLSLMSQLNELIRALVSPKENAEVPQARWRVGMALGAVGFRRKRSEVHPDIKTELGGIAIIDAVRIMSGIKPDQWAINQAGFASLAPDQQRMFPRAGKVKGKKHELDENKQRMTIPIFRGSALN